MAQQVDPAAWVTAVMQVRSLPENFHMPWAQPKKKEKKSQPRSAVRHGKRMSLTVKLDFQDTFSNSFIGSQEVR